MLVEDALQMTNAVVLIICWFFESEASRKSLFNPDRFTSTQARGQRHAGFPPAGRRRHSRDARAALKKAADGFVLGIRGEGPRL